MPLRRPASLATSLALAAAVAVSGSAVIESSQPAAAATRVATGTQHDTRTNARFYVAGYLWSDGWGSNPHLGFRTASPQIAARFGLATRSLGMRVDQGKHGRFATFRLRSRVDVPLDRVPPVLRGASLAQTKAFLAAVIEGEGSRSGLVIDDPKRAHVAVVQRLLRRVGIRSRVEGVNFYRLYAARSDWRKFNSFPFVTRSRVPGARR